MVSFCNLGSMIDVQNKDYFEQSPLYGGVSSLVFIFIKLFGFTKKNRRRSGKYNDYFRNPLTLGR